MNLVFYSPRFFPLVGGLEKVVRVWATAMQGLGHQVSVITDTPLADEKDEFDFKVFRHVSPIQQLQLFRKSDLVVCFNISLKILPIVKLAGCRLLISHHTALFYPGGKSSWKQRLKKWVSNHVAVLNICCSYYIAGQFVNASVVYSPFEKEFFFNYYSARKKNSLVYVGRLVSDKGVDVLLKAFSSLAQEIPALSLTIVGDGPEKISLEQMATDLGLSKLVNFLGSLSANEIVTLLNRQEIMVVPSRMEPFGTTVLEGLACGCRMIVSDQGGLPEAGNGWVKYFSSENVSDLMRAIREEIAQPAAHPIDEVDNYLAAYSVWNTALQFSRQLETISK